MKNTKTILDKSNQWIEDAVQIALDRELGSIESGVDKFGAIYFAGATLCMDLNTPEEKEVLTICYNDESVGYFSGGIRMGLSITACKNLERLMSLKGKLKQNKWLARDPEQKELVQ